MALETGCIKRDDAPKKRSGFKNGQKTFSLNAIQLMGFVVWNGDSRTPFSVELKFGLRVIARPSSRAFRGIVQSFQNGCAKHSGVYGASSIVRRPAPRGCVWLCVCVWTWGGGRGEECGFVGSTPPPP